MSEKKKPVEYTAEFRESAVKLAVESAHPISQTAKELGVNKNTLYTWIGQFHRPIQVSRYAAGFSMPPFRQHQ